MEEDVDVCCAIVAALALCSRRNSFPATLLVAMAASLSGVVLLVGGVIVEPSILLFRGWFRVKTWSNRRVMAAPLAPRPCWRHRFLKPR